MNEGERVSTEALRVVVVGARRHHQGLGYHLARFVEQAGGSVVGIVGTSDETVAAAQAGLGSLGIHPVGGTEAARLVRDLSPDALVVASPSETHDAYLRLGRERGLHVLCEKPLCWGASDVAERAGDHAHAFARRGLHLVVNAQWPYTLEAWRRLFPGVLGGEPRRFWMRLSPDSTGARMLPDALPHALSLLLAVAPHEAPVVEDVRIEGASPRSESLVVHFTYRAGARSVASTVELVRGRVQPREAGYGFDGRRAMRRVRLADYRLSLEADGRSVDLPDPTPRLVRSFVRRVSSGLPATVDPNAWPGTGLLAAIHDAWPDGTND